MQQIRNKKLCHEIQTTSATVDSHAVLDVSFPDTGVGDRIINKHVLGSML